MRVREIWRWIDNDLNNTRPWSFLLVIVPLLPAWAFNAAGASKSTEDTAFLAGAAVSGVWFAYVVWRGLSNIVRSFQKTTAYFRSASKDRHND
ncbi:MAG: hypothetical protein J7485_14055 [Sphingobium sp.]|nr:hypothetical protein [Sphingobium sp.]